jgi:LEA14-like dessication related protein
MIKKLYFLPVLLLIVSISSCSLYEELKMLGVQEYNFQMSESNILTNIDFKINNPNVYSIKLKKSNFQVFMGEDEIGVAEMTEDLMIEKKAEKVYTLKLKLAENALKNKLLPLMKKALFQKTIKFQIKGKVHCKVWGILGKKIDLNESKEISLSELLSNLKL